MAMVVKNNLSANNTLNKLNANNSALAKAMKKISSGMRITGAGDDASGYAISERMQTRIRGLAQCGNNTNFGNKLLTVASEAVDQQIQIVSKLREIALKSSDDTYAQVDRDVLQGETNQMLMQLNAISWETNYNGIPLLHGLTKGDNPSFNPDTPAKPNTKATDLFVGANYTPLKSNPSTGSLPGQHPAAGSTYPESGGTTILDFSQSTATNIPGDFDGQGMTILCADCNLYVTINWTASMPLGEGERYDAPGTSAVSCVYFLGIGGATSYDDIESSVYDGVVYANQKKPRPGGMPDNQLMLHHEVTAEKQSNGDIKLFQSGNPMVLYEGTKGDLDGYGPWTNLYIQSDTPASQNTRLQLFDTTLDTLFPPASSKLSLDPPYESYPTEFSSDYPDDLSLQEKQEMWREKEWPYPKKGAEASGSCVRTREKANRFLGDIDQALKYLLHVNTSLGSQINRMDICNANIVTTHENTQNAESTIRDADMAKEMMTYTKNNVLSQTAQSMLSQANQNVGGVLDLLQ